MTGATGLLAPGEYHVVVRAVGASTPVSFAVRGSGFSDPIGPQPSDSATAPQYTDPSAPGRYLYPDGTATTDPYLWILWLVI